MVVKENIPKVEKTKKVNGKLVAVTIFFWPFRMKFGQKKGKAYLISPFERFDNSQDEPDWIPPMYFNPAKSLADSVFSDHRKRERKKEKTLQHQARLIP